MGIINDEFVKYKATTIACDRILRMLEQLRNNVILIKAGATGGVSMAKVLAAKMEEQLDENINEALVNELRGKIINDIGKSA